MTDAPLASDLDEIVREAEGAVAAALDADAKQAAAKKAVVDAASAITDKGQAAITKLYGYLQPGKPAPVLAIFFPTELPPVADTPVVVVVEPAPVVEAPVVVEPPVVDAPVVVETPVVEAPVEPVPAPVEQPPAPPAEPEFVAEDEIVVEPPALPEPEPVVAPELPFEPVIDVVIAEPGAEAPVEPQPTFPADEVTVPAADVAPATSDAPAADGGPVITQGVPSNG